jgi:phytoene synthase
MITDTQLETSKAIQQRTGRTFHVATRFLPERVRHATYVLYAFFRTADDIVDDPDPVAVAERRERLATLREAALGHEETDDLVISAFNEVRETHGIPDDEVNAFVDAMAADVDPDGIESYGDLEVYMRGSAVAVGNMMLAVMDPEDIDAARPHARALSEAFQLTNFIRDVREDIVDLDRIYLPRETLAQYGVPAEQLRDLEFSEGVAAAVRSELTRTEALYRQGVAGIQLLPPDCQFPVLLSAVLYAEHHRLIRAQGYDVVSKRPALSRLDSLRAVIRTWWHWRRDPDPVAVFHRVSAIPRSPGDRTDRSGWGHRRIIPRSIGRSAREVISRVSAWAVD